jgi:hypothetical protein
VAAAGELVRRRFFSAGGEEPNGAGADETSVAATAGGKDPAADEGG